MFDIYYHWQKLKKRLFNIDPASLTEELLILNKFEIASGYLRTGNILHCNEAYALKASRLFIENGIDLKELPYSI